MIQSQLNNLINNLPQIVTLAQDQVNHMVSNKWISSYLENNQINYSTKISDYANSVLSNTGSAFNAIFSFISHIVILLSTVPFILFYLLKDGDKIPAFLFRFIPSRFNEEGQKILGEMDSALSSYIQGKVVVSFCLGLLIYLGYSIIGIEYSLILALSATLMNVIPFIGLFIGIIPSVIVAFIHSPGMVLKVLIVVLVVQQLESNFLSPQIMGKKLDIHPLTIILLLIVVGKFAGLLGMFLAIPTYAILKVIVIHLLRFNVLRKQ